MGKYNYKELYEKIKIPDGVGVSYARVIIDGKHARTVGHARDDLINSAIRDQCMNPQRQKDLENPDKILHEICFLLFRYGARWSRGNRKLVGVIKIMYNDRWEDGRIDGYRVMLPKGYEITFKPGDDRSTERCLELYRKYLEEEVFRRRIRLVAENSFYGVTGTMSNILPLE